MKLTFFYFIICFTLSTSSLYVIPNSDIYYPQAINNYELEDDEYYLELENLVSSTYISFATNTSLYLYPNKSIDYFYVISGADIQNHQLRIHTSQNLTNLQLYLNASDTNYDLFYGKIFQNELHQRFIFNSKFTSYIISNEAFQLSLTDYNVYSTFVIAEYDTVYQKIEYTVLNTEYNYEQHRISTTINATTGSLIFVARNISSGKNTIAIWLGCTSACILIIGLGIVFRKKPLDAHHCSYPKKFINGKCQKIQ